MNNLPRGVNRAVSGLGSALRTARIRRRFSQKDMATLMRVSIGTVQRIERGDPGVSIGSIGMALLCLNSLDKLTRLMDPTTDEIGMAADAFRLPKRVRSTLSKQEHSSDNTVTSPEPMVF